MTINIRVLFFGATARDVGDTQLDLPLPAGSTAKTAFEQLKQEFPALANHKILFALDQKYVSGDEPLNEGGELAIFTAVSGG